MHIRLIYTASGKGLQRDAALLREILQEAGHRLETVVLKPTGRWQAWLSGCFERRVAGAPRPLAAALVRLRMALGYRIGARADLNIFLEDLKPGWLLRARCNLLIPNQEWFRPGRLPWLPWVARVLCKTREAERVFAALGCRTEFTSFTSEDKFRRGQPKDYGLALHFAGAGLTKGTAPLLQAWQRHPEWPRLLVTQRGDQPLPSAGNIRAMPGYVGEGELSALQAGCGFYLGPSQAEGFGHALVEAMSAGAIVITTDAPPMNEIVSPERGVLVPVCGGTPFRLGTRYDCTVEALERAVARALGLGEAERAAMGEAARRWYLENDAFFRRRLLEVLDSVQP